MHSGKMGLWLAFCSFAVLSGCSGESARIVVLDCDGPLARDYSCPSVFRASAAIEIRVNVQNGNVLFDTKSDPTHNFIIGERIRSGCKIIDDENWKCTNESTAVTPPPLLSIEEGMSHGTYYRTSSGLGLNSYDSSMADLLANLVVSGWMSVETAFEFWKWCWRMGVSPYTIEFFAFIGAMVIGGLTVFQPEFWKALSKI